MKKIYSITTFIFIALFSVSGINPLVACDAEMQTIQGGFCLQVVPDGTAPFVFTWDDGSNLDYFCPNAFGVYCVTIADADGCIATACGTIGNPAQDSCSVYITETLTSAGALLEATPNGTGPVTYIWSNGETSSSITALENGTYCITITDESGCTASDCQNVNLDAGLCDIWIEVDSTFAGTILTANTNIITDDYMFFWNNNVTGASYPVTESGTYCVTVTSASCANGANVACIDISLGGNNSCGVSIFSGSPNGGEGLYASATGTAPFTYTWNTGELASSIFPAQDGYYCVTITDVTGCTGESCYFYSNTVDSCGVYINAQPGNASGFLSAVGNGIAPIDYIWSNGEVTPDIIVQQEGTYCVTLVDGTNCEASDCFYYSPFQDTTCYIMVQSIQGGNCLQASGTGTTNYEYIWENGDVGSVFCANAPGTYCVVAVDLLTGCTATACGQIGNIPVDSCSVQLTLFDNPAGSSLMATAAGTAPFTYEWSTGELTPEIMLTANGTYCVTVTDASGCTSTTCSDYSTNPQDSCYIQLELLASGNYQLTANSSAPPNTIVLYQWDNGQTDQTTVAAPGDSHCVTMTNVDGATCSVCIEVPPFTGSLISGFVYLADSSAVANTGGTVYLYSALNSSGQSGLIASYNLQFSGASGSAFYIFENVPPGEYIVKATVSFGLNAPTYYGDVLYWDEAEIIVIPSALNLYYNIQLQPEGGANGPGGVNGNITDGDGFTGHDADRDPETAIEGATVFAIDQAGNIAGFDITDSEGFFEIDGLEDGMYDICVDYPGQHHFCHPVIISNGEVINIDFIIDEAGITTGLDFVSGEHTISISPNPVKEWLNVVHDDNIDRINVYTVTGVLVSSLIEPNNKSNRIDVSQLEAGIYFIEVADRHKRISTKFIKL